MTGAMEGAMEECKDNLAGKAEALRRCLKDQVRHPYITGQGLESQEAQCKNSDSAVAAAPKDREE
jgi:hypothetical protein